MYNRYMRFEPTPHFCTLFFLIFSNKNNFNSKICFKTEDQKHENVKRND